MDKVVYNIYKTPDGGAKMKKAEVVDGEALGSVIYTPEAVRDVLPIMWYLTMAIANEVGEPAAEIEIGK